MCPPSEELKGRNCTSTQRTEIESSPVLSKTGIACLPWIAVFNLSRSSRTALSFESNDSSEWGRAFDYLIASALS